MCSIKNYLLTLILWVSDYWNVCLTQYQLFPHFFPFPPPLSPSPVADSPQQMLTRPVWVPDAVAKDCMICQMRFSTFVRKHHCRRCGRVVCSACSPHHVSLTAADSALTGHAPSEHSKLERVCKECFKEMTAQHNRCELTCKESSCDV